MLAYPEVAHCKVIKAQIQPTSTFRSFENQSGDNEMAICRKMFLKTLDFSAVADDIKLFCGKSGSRTLLQKNFTVQKV